jgi:hypothetical protein
MASTFAEVVVIVPLLAQDISIAICMMFGSAFLADVVGAAHEGR